MKTVLMLLCMIILFSSVFYSQNKDSTLTNIDWGISLNTGYSSYGTGLSIHKNVLQNLTLEVSYGVDLIIIPFFRFGPASNEHLIGIGGNYFISKDFNLAINFTTFLHINPTTEEIIGDKRYISIATHFGFIPRSSKDIPFFLKLGLNYELKKSIDNRKMELNLAFGLLISL